MSLADGYIGSFDTKYSYNYWRPVTAIRAADTDGNPDTQADPDWTPLQPTPAIPDYDSAHSVEGGAGAAVLARVLGDRTPFAACSSTLPAGSNCTEATPVLRHYNSFSQAAAENGSPASSSASTSARRWTRASRTAAASATAPSTASCGRAANR